MKKKLLLFMIGIATATISFSQNPAINFDGSNDYISTTFGGVTGSTDRTFEAWIYIDPTAPASNLCVLDYGTNASGDRNTFMVTGSRKLALFSGGTSGNLSSSNNNDVPVGQWTHVAAVLNGGAGYLYVNGVQVGTGTLAGISTPTTGEDMKIGRRVAGGTLYFKGSIDEVKVYNVARSATDILADMNNEVCTITSSLVAYYRMNDGIINGTNVASTVDLSGGNNTGTLNNFDLTGVASNWTTGPVLNGGFTTSTIVANECSDYTAPSGTVYTTSGQYSETITNAAGCDSIIQIDLTIAPLASSITETTCSSFTSPSGAYTWVSTGVYTDTLLTTAGCDSVVTVDLTIQNYSTTIIGGDCDAYTSLSGNNTWTTSGMYAEVFSTTTGCDSTINYNVTIYTESGSTITTSTCTDYTSPSGVLYSATGVYTETFTNLNGCDSIVTIDLTVVDVVNTVSVTGATLMADLSGATYQWYSCVDANLFIIPGETNQSYTATLNGNYAVEINLNGCMNTSSCTNIDFTGVEEDAINAATIFPNPAVNGFTIDLGQDKANVTIQILNLEGKVIKSYNGLNTNKIVVQEQLPAGAYIIRINHEENIQNLKFIQE
ncbi:hypothetical protein DNU06_06210 [Putridiphycobacter roseus]|uniref:LamG-like jellyroll fold domain-containing protein n=1 Tax=Putridiphycobacter roseus TaxID=2219161 RepID=A0A2W1NFF4_9FLAO|nr:LamG-like jellyroll fold domain-containing protein [Putridiphycobacter roseus]PZE18205.1 hypothetical protein DNU06_06210 [Putridiphycobacter roseus]